MSSPSVGREAVIVIAGDQVLPVRLLHTILGRAGFRHLHATSDPEAVLPLCRATRADLVLLNIQSPRGGTIDLLHALRRPGTRRRLPVVMVVPDEMAGEAQVWATTAGACTVVPKPFNRFDVVAAVEQVVATCRTPARRPRGSAARRAGASRSGLVVVRTQPQIDLGPAPPRTRAA